MNPVSTNPWPKAYVIGALKAGTTSLHAFLKRHRSFYVPDRKYLRYFAREIHPQFCWGHDQADHERIYLKEFLGAKPDQVTVDCENMTILNAAAPARLAAANPDARIVVVLRDPIERAWSHFLSNHERGIDPRSPADALLSPPQPFPGMLVPDRYIEAGLYYKLLSRYLEFFPREQLLLLSYEELTAQPDLAQQRLCAFMGVQDDFKVRLGTIRENETLVARNSLVRRLHQFRHGRLGSRLRRVLPHYLLSRLQAFMFVSTKDRTMPTHLRLELVARFGEDIALLQDCFGFSTESWRKDWRELGKGPFPYVRLRRFATSNSAAVAMATHALNIVSRIEGKRKTTPSHEEATRIAELRAAFAQIDREASGATPSEKIWLKNMRRLGDLVEMRDPRSFLRWDVVRATMFFENIPFIAEELAALRRDPEWHSIWATAIIESNVGQPIRYPFWPQTSGNLVHHAYHLWRFERCINSPITEYEFIFEFGGGYGSMARMARNLGFRGKYVIFDLPAFSALQRFYLSSLGFEVASLLSESSAASTVCTSSLAELLSVLPSLRNNKRFFIATWSISETSASLRSQVMPLIEGFDGVLIAYQDRFQEVDNISYFQNWAITLKQDLKLMTESIEHMAGNYYLFGKRAR